MTFKFIHMKYNLLTLAAVFFVISCSQKQNADEVSSEKVVEAAFFTANPQDVPEQEVTTLKVGEKAPDFNLPGTDGRFWQLSDFDDAEVLVIIFTCNHCPTAQAYEDRMIQMTNDYKDKGVQVVAISPNSINGLLLNELGWSDMGDSFEDMIVRVKDKGYNFPYLYDGDDHAVSIQYGPVATPHAYVFDKDRMLTYVGRLDALERPEKGGNSEDLRAALDATLKGQPVENPTTKTFGCSIKWAWKSDYAIQVNKEWSEKEVTLEEIDSDGIKAMLKNDTEDFRLVNIWATWCGPCVIEYPDFVDIHRMYSHRGFEFVSVSADNLASKDKALKFLKKKNSAVTNYIFSEEDKYALIEAVDPEWDGALPYTVLLEPGGKVVYKKMGSVDPFELKKTIVEQPSMGRYF